MVSLDHCYEAGATFDEVYTSIVDIVRAGAAEHGRVAYAVPGSPAVAERTVELLRSEESIELEVVPGLSFCDLAWERLGIDPIEAGVRLVDAESFAVQAAGDAGPLLVGQCWSQAVLSSVKLCFDIDPGPAILLHHMGLADEAIVEVPWSEIDRTLEADHLTSLYVPHLAVPIARELTRLTELVRVLRDRCPWDREQTHHSLVPHLLEETYEAMEAIEGLGDDPAGAPPAAAAHVSEELGDLLCQVLFHATLAEEEGLFNLADVARSVHDKLVVRHPHVFGDVTATTPGAVLANWERNKHAEKQRTHLFEGIPPRCRPWRGLPRPSASWQAWGLAGLRRDWMPERWSLRWPECWCSPTRTLLSIRARLRLSALCCWRRRGSLRTGARTLSRSCARPSSVWAPGWRRQKRPPGAPAPTSAHWIPPFVSTCGARQTPSPEVPSRARAPLAQWGPVTLLTWITPFTGDTGSEPDSAPFRTGGPRFPGQPHY